jgi:hypothetical protein
MPKASEGNQTQNDNVVEIKGKKFTVTPEFKKVLDEHTTELTTKVKATETQVQTLSERIAALGKAPVKGAQDDAVVDDDDQPLEFADIMDRPQAAIDKAVQRALKKAGLKPGASGNTDDVEKKIELKMAQRAYWADFYREHDYFEEDTHGDVIQLMARKLLPSIKDLSPKESRKKIAEAMADFMGRKLKNGKLEIATDSKHTPTNGMQLESADGGVVDNGGNADDTSPRKDSGSMSDILRTRAEARKKGGKK